MASYVSHGSSFARGDSLKFGQMGLSAMQVEPFGKMFRRDLEQVLIQGRTSAPPNLDKQTARPGENDITIIKDTGRIYVRPCPFATIGMPAPQWRYLYHGQAVVIGSGSISLQSKTVAKVRNFI